MFGSLDLTPDLLATQGRALRGLARSLLRDADAAEDVVQETWLACLKRPQVMPERVSAWLGTVASRLALRRKRGDSRRRVREARAATPERLEALQQRTLEREEALRTVTEALLGLEEPFKSALLLRYYEERTPNEIAAELGLPVTTVKSRIARGLERLRARLGAEFGDETRRARALLVLAGAPRLALVGPAALGTAAAVPMLTTLGAVGLAAVALALLAGGALSWWNQPQEERLGVVSARQESRSEARAGLFGSSASQAQTPATSAQSDGETKREALAPEGEESARAEPFPAERAFLYRLSGIVRDERDLPLADARVFLGPRLFPLNRVAVTDEHGRFALEFEGRRSTLDCAFSVDAPGGNALGLRELRLVAGQELVVEVGLRPRATDVAVVDADEAILVSGIQLESEDPAVAPIRYTFPEGEPEVVRQVATILAGRLSGVAASSAPLDRAPELSRRADGRGVFVDPPPAQACAHPDAARSASGLWLRSAPPLSRRPLFLNQIDRVFVEGSLQLQPYERIHGFALARRALVEDAALATVRGFVRDAAGNPLAEIDVGWSLPGCAPSECVRSDEQGAFELDGIPAGEVELRAGGGDHGRASERITLAAGAEHTWNAVLDRGDEVTGRVVLSTGDALSDQRVELWSVSSSFVWCDSTSTDEDGRFAFPNVPAGALELLVYTAGPVERASAFPVRTLGPVFACSDVGEIVLGVKDLIPHTLTATLLDADGEPLPAAELRVWHEGTGRGLFAAEAEEGGKFVLAGLSAGSYRVEAGSPFGWRDLGRVWIDGEDLELASERFARPGALVLDVAGGSAAAALSLWGAHPDVFARVAADDELGLRPLMLAPGGYILCADPKRGQRVETELEVRSEAANALALRVEDEAARFEVDAARRLAGDSGSSLSLLDTNQASCTKCHAGTEGLR